VLDSEARWNESRADVSRSSDRTPLRAQLRRGWERLRGGELTPERAFWSVGIGLFVGVQPTPGLHLPIVLAVGIPLRLDVALSYLATNISIPPFAPFLWFAGIQIGSRILRGRFAPLSLDGLRALVRAPGPLLGALVLGSIILGVVLGAAGGLLAYAVARSRRSTATDAGPSSGTPEEPRRRP
jgi:uncharacterized protein (DUF2062 family)